MSVQLLTGRDSDTGVLELLDGESSTKFVAVAETQDVPNEICGPGPCNDCACQGFTGSSYICETCQHPYNHHAG